MAPLTLVTSAAHDHPRHKERSYAATAPVTSNRAAGLFAFRHASCRFKFRKRACDDPRSFVNRGPGARFPDDEFGFREILHRRFRMFSGFMEPCEQSAARHRAEPVRAR